MKNSSLTNVDRCVSGWEATAAAGQGRGLVSGPFAEEAQDRKQLFNESQQAFKIGGAVVERRAEIH